MPFACLLQLAIDIGLPRTVCGHEQSFDIQAWIVDNLKDTSSMAGKWTIHH